VNAKTANLATVSGFRLTWRSTQKLAKKTSVVLGLDTDDPTGSLEHFVQGYSRYSFAYINEGLGGEESKRPRILPPGRPL
jgi:hypothetical protein